MATVYRRANSPFYQARIRVGDERHRISTGERDKRKAQAAADAAEVEAQRQLIQSNELRIQTAAERFFGLKKDLRAKTVQNYKSNLTNLVSKLGDFPLRLLDHDRLRHYVSVRLQEVGSVAIRRDLAFLSSVYSTLTPDHNPVRSFSKRGLPEARKLNRWLTEDEVNRLIAVAKEPYQKRFIILLVQTGMRVGELISLDWSSIKLKDGLIVLMGDQTKNKDYRIIPLTEEALGTLRDTHESVRKGPLFLNERTGKPYTTLRTFWKNACTAAKVEDAKIHTLRHTFASWGLQRGLNQLTLQDWMGHKTSSMTRRYAKSSNDSLLAAARRFSGDTKSDTQPSD